MRRPQVGLVTVPLIHWLQAQLHQVQRAGGWRLRTFVIMPDHFHLVVTLGTSIDLSEAMRQFKGPLSPVLRYHQLAWQRNFYDHRLRSADEDLPTFLYVFLNPYRAGLVGAGQTYPWYYCAPEDWEWFGGMTNEARPFPEWLK